MPDPAAQWLLEQMHTQGSAHSLWCADEHAVELLASLERWPTKPALLTNRYDVFAQAQQLGFQAEFNDFDFTNYRDQSLQQVFYRISKEKPLVHHSINEAHRVLAPGGTLFLCGQKNEGIKTYADKTARLFAAPSNLKKQGSIYSAMLQRQHDQGPALDDKDYPQARQILEHDDLRVFSKPGLFGWDKVDRGSEFLIEQLPSALEALAEPPSTMLDLGCGYGYLTLMSRQLPLQRRVLTDNNAAAVQMAALNCRENGLDAQVIAADCGDQLQERFDLILCNPPFHQGFSVNDDLTQRFLSATQRLLHRSGIAVFVVNAFIPLERLAAVSFHSTVLGNNGRFKVLQLRQR